MLGNPFGENRDERLAREHETRQMNFAREQNVVGNSMNDDATYIHFKEKNEDLMRWQQDLEDELNQLIHRLKNEIRIDGVWIPRVDSQGEPLPPILNEKGISDIFSEICPLMSRNLINSNYTEEQIYQRMRETADSITYLLMQNYEYYDMEMNVSRFDSIINQIIDVILPTFLRALNDGERRHQRTINKRVEAYNENLTKDKQSGIRGLFGM